MAGGRCGAEFRPPLRGSDVLGWHSQGCAALHPELFSCSPSGRRKDAGASDTEVVGTPGFDTLFDLFAIELLFEGGFGQRDDFVIGCETEADQLVCGEAINLRVPLDWCQGL